MLSWTFLIFSITRNLWGNSFSFVMSASNEWAKYVPWVTTGLLGGYVMYKVVRKDSSSWVNKTQQKDSAKVVHVFDIEDLGDKAVYCRCWRSKKFPECDGSHTTHNKCTGDNVGPLVIKKSS